MSEFIEPGFNGYARYNIKTTRTTLTNSIHDPDENSGEATGMVTFNLDEEEENTFINGLSETTDSYFRTHDLEEVSRPVLDPSRTLNNWIPMTGEPAGKNAVLDEFLEYIVIDNIQSILEELKSTSGFIAAALVDANSGMTMGSVTAVANFDIEIAAATNTDVVKAKMKAMEALGLDDNIEDILITLGSQYHVIRPLKNEPFIFVYLAVDRGNANLALCRRAMALTEEKLKV